MSAPAPCSSRAVLEWKEARSPACSCGSVLWLRPALARPWPAPASPTYSNTQRQNLGLTSELRSRQGGQETVRVRETAPCPQILPRDRQPWDRGRGESRGQWVEKGEENGVRTSGLKSISV